jgi:hypothetical protein
LRALSAAALSRLASATAYGNGASLGTGLTNGWLVACNIPENINFAIKTSAIRDFLDNSVVPYETAEGKGELKTTEIADAARAYTLLIPCTATEQADSAKR